VTERERYGDRVRALLHLLDIRHFGPFELCDVGKTRADGTKLRAPAQHRDLHMAATIVRLEHVRRAAGYRIRITSGYRDPAYNRSVGGSTASWHMAFNAFDLVPLDHGNLADLWDRLTGLPNSRLFGLGRYNSQGFIHFDTRGIVSPGTPGWRSIQ
jgi:hypothetical protein